MSKLTVKLDIAGKPFALAYEIPDVAGHIPFTDQNEKWLEERLAMALRPVVGKLTRAPLYTPPARKAETVI